MSCAILEWNLWMRVMHPVQSPHSCTPSGWWVPVPDRASGVQCDGSFSWTINTGVRWSADITDIREMQTCVRWITFEGLPWLQSAQKILIWTRKLGRVRVVTHWNEKAFPKIQTLVLPSQELLIAIALAIIVVELVSCQCTEHWYCARLNSGQAIHTTPPHYMQAHRAS